MARRTLKDADKEIAKLKAQLEFHKTQRTALQLAFADLMQDIFIGEDAAAEIAREAVSERIW